MISEAPQAGPVVLVVDDESVIADTLTEILNRNGYRAMAAYSAEEALDTALDHPPLMLISDVMLPGINGIDLAIRLKRIYPDLEVVLFSGHTRTGELLVSAQKSGHDFSLLAKPVHPQDILARVGQRIRPSSTVLSSN